MAQAVQKQPSASLRFNVSSSCFGQKRFMVRPTGETMSKFDRRQALKAGGTLAVAALVGSDARSTLALPPAPSEEQL
jgi:hypothetical protein